MAACMLDTDSFGNMPNEVYNGQSSAYIWHFRICDHAFWWCHQEHGYESMMHWPARWTIAAMSRTFLSVLWCLFVQIVLLVRLCDIWKSISLLCDDEQTSSLETVKSWSYKFWSSDALTRMLPVKRNALACKARCIDPAVGDRPNQTGGCQLRSCRDQLPILKHHKTSSRHLLRKYRCFK